MQRRDFLKRGCLACLSLSAMSALTNCSATKYVSGDLGKDGLTVNKADFQINRGGSIAYSSFIVVRNASLKFPICIYRHSDNDYSALWMRCTHQGAELQASGDVLQCVAHGSEFNNRGQIISGPAGSNLRIFPVTISDKELFIDLRKQS